MHVLVTGVTGTIGGAVARALIRRGHDVTGIVRDASTRSGAPDGVNIVVADLFVNSDLSDIAQRVDGAVHAASSNDELAGKLDKSVVNTLVAAFDGTEKPLVYTSGLWVHGNVGSTPLSEESPLAPPIVVAWRPEVEQTVLAAARRGVRTVRIRPGLVYGNGRGYAPKVFAPHEHDGQRIVRYFGDGSNRWAVVHADDLGDLYTLAVESAPAGSVYLGVSEESVTVREAAKAVAERHAAQIQAWDPIDAQRHWSVLVEALMLDQVATPAHARTELGWQPQQSCLMRELTDK